jgi:hypothetical protein
MPKYNKNLEEYLEDNINIDPGFTFMAVSQLIDAFQIVHCSGRTYNDLKP